MLATYLVALFAMAFSAASALTIFWAFRHFDPPEAAVQSRVEEQVTV
jgi:hypothetical protein